MCTTKVVGIQIGRKSAGLPDLRPSPANSAYITRKQTPRRIKILLPLRFNIPDQNNLNRFTLLETSTPSPPVVKQIYLIRHGQTNYNRMGVVQGGGIDSDLNEFGNRQAQAFFSHYQEVPFDKVYTSTLKRSIQSVQQFIDKGIPWEKYAGLNEINWGYREGIRITPEEDAYYYRVISAWNSGQVDLKIEGGESPNDVQARQKPVLDLILSRPEEKTILICMHGRAMRILLCLMLNYPLHCMDMFEHQNLCLYKLIYTGNLFRAETFNDVTHVQGIEE